jgi:acyl carrier protein
VDLRARVRSYIVDELLVDQGQAGVGDRQELLLSGLLDSLAVVRLVSFIETDLQVRVPPEDVTIDHFEHVDAIVTYLQARAGRQP